MLIVKVIAYAVDGQGNCQLRRGMQIETKRDLDLILVNSFLLNTKFDQSLRTICNGIAFSNIYHNLPNLFVVKNGIRILQSDRHFPHLQRHLAGGSLCSTISKLRIYADPQLAPMRMLVVFVTTGPKSGFICAM